MSTVWSVPAPTATPPPRLLDQIRQAALNRFGRREPGERYAEWVRRFVFGRWLPFLWSAHCSNRPQRTEDLDALVWQDVCQLLREPDRLRQEFERRQQGSVADHPAQSERLRTAIRKAKQGIGCLLDAYAAGLVEPSDFEPRIKSLKRGPVTTLLEAWAPCKLFFDSWDGTPGYESGPRGGTSHRTMT